MTASVITALVPSTEDVTLGRTPYRLEIKGKPAYGVRVAELLDTDTGQRSVEIIAPAPEGKPVLSLSTMDAVARRILDGARVAFNGLGTSTQRRVYKP